MVFLVSLLHAAGMCMMGCVLRCLTANGELPIQFSQDSQQPSLPGASLTDRASLPEADAAALDAQQPPPAKRQKSAGLGVTNGATGASSGVPPQTSGGASRGAHAAGQQPPAPSSNAAAAKRAVIPKTGDPARYCGARTVHCDSLR